MSDDVFADLRCPHCGESDMVVKLSDLEVTCYACDETITREEVAAVADRWIALFRWIDSANA